MTGVGVIGVLPALLFLFYLVLAGLILYALILFIRLARRGIEALDIYLRDKRGR